MRRLLPTLIVNLVILAAGAGLWTVVAREEEPPTAPPRDLGPTPVRVQSLRARDLDVRLEVYGSLRERRALVLASELTGRLAEVHGGWRPGGRVRAGEVLFALDAVPFELEARAAEARVEEAQATLERARLEEDRR